MTSVQRARAQYDAHWKNCSRCLLTVGKPFWAKSGLCVIGRRLMDKVRLLGDKELHQTQERKETL